MTPDTPRASRPLPRAALCGLLLALALLAGCVAKPPLARTPDAQSGVPVRDVEARAAQAFEAGDHATSQTLYSRLLERGGLAPESEALAWQRLADSALAQGQPDTALQALRSLVRLHPRAADGWDYNRALIEALVRSGQPEQARAHLHGLLHDAARPWDLRLRAGLSVARDLWAERRYEDAMRVLERLYADSPEPSPVPRGQFEAGLLAELQGLDDATLADLVRLTPVQSQWNFPYTIIRLEQARRLGLQEKNWPTAWHILSGISRKGEVADKTLVGGVLTPLRSRFGMPSGGVALALPLSGPFAEIGWKVLRGAGAAQWDLLAHGGQMNVQVINTDAPGWLDEVAALPDDCALMGGPLQLDRLHELRGRALLGRRPVFAFLPRLEGAQEGRDAWRLFSSVEDQVRALANLSAGTLGIRRHAVLAPDEAFGQRYVQAFAQEAAARQAEITATGTYPGADPTRWGAAVAALLGVDPRAHKDGRLPPDPGFRAVFLPDGWAQARVLAPQFFFYDEDRLLLLGPALWAQGLEQDPGVELNYFRLAVFPGAWWADNPAPGAQALREAMRADGLGAPDLWVALGHDFIQLAQVVAPLPASWTPRMVNDALAGAAEVPWSMAPMRWDEAGLASQELFLFQPAPGGAAPVDPAQLAARLERVRVRHDERASSLRRKNEIEALRRMQKADPENQQVNQRLHDLLQERDAQ
ncbi:penicillin-binding protein activator [Desulfocurvus sp.]|jgi:hypothetical protein|uniref:penicillin-binding protein activator n=1 Tax=Desulfocurvus sp. TaxID=2871698 RepID=UPI0025BC12F5|nr:penicillin-binding protein activator [Desulfocurvus sp.]MCK9239714.1 penicillin-binding protein activator [Desulfocurvus sp.]